MTDRRISLTLVLHNHQPVGNFGFVFEDNYRAAYEPLLAALQRHPGVRLGLHYTGPLLDWFKAHKPEALEQLRGLVDRGQVEILGGGYYEPVLASLRETDRVGQLTRMADEVESLFGRRPGGAWLAERVWEPDVPTSLAKAGYAYTIVDDAHFRAAAIPAERHWGSYSTDDQGYRVIVYGSEQGLRYRIPFRPVEEVIEYLREHATEDGELVGMMGDDGEKFGTWPGTWELCHGKGGWVERFFSALEENRDWLTLLQPAEALDHAPAHRSRLPAHRVLRRDGRVVAARGGAARVHAPAPRGRGRRASRRRAGCAAASGAASRSTTARSTTSTSRCCASRARWTPCATGRPGGTDAGDQLARIADHLYQGQSNDCYWHGLFGGIYLSHMRLATLEHLIAAEDAADRAAGASGVTIETVDLDIDGYDELLVSTPGQVVAIKPGEGGGIGSWDVRAVRHALASVMRRRPEAYHDTLRAADSGEVEEQEAGEGAVSIHDLIKVNEPGISKRLWYDAYERRSGLVHLLPIGTTPGRVRAGRLRGAGRLRQRHLRGRGGGRGPRRAGARRVHPGRPTARARRCGCASPSSSGPTDACRRWTSRWTSPTPAASRSRPSWASSGRSTCWVVAAIPRPGTRSAGTAARFDARRMADGADHVSMGNSYIGIELESRPQPAAAAWWSSIETISVSESGFEGNHQGGCLLWVWPLRLEPGATARFQLANLVRTFADRAEEEGL